MKQVFVDTSALIAIGNRRDAFHAQALTIRDELRLSQRYFVTTDAILLEFGNAFGAVNLKPTAVKMIEAVRGSEKWQRISLDDTLMERGFQQFKQMADKDWGFVDCISILVARDMGIKEIFSTDHHFEQAGFNILLKK
ncbi:type II toxin-antitoxin system VapC family toxin [Desulfobulbus sp. F5]|nr:type II toxin-antitoxin system VapC family toxin [Desulfobulbus sp. F5]